MGIFRLFFRTFRLLSMLYMVFRASRLTRAIWLVSTLWRIFRRRSGAIQRPKVVFTFVGPRDETIYRRRGWRRISKGEGDGQ
ncbi:hypothetical protein NZD89_19240 [Alicyclobacillus fastidiosus]|uniref:Secreted protein n=1 Tax=Alicyclobacillus fastidiosus TaxID=392011 RepID=A0ABY6ZC63_9BACL|nr:hypothetical protein [Alicyclobacillus fastidiosus]WAH40452.1 hypothetical protein NZD89_19240 [Alicyclobacillus fastidiosus]GMA61855.1 hypothetical protein GCM10025859_22950 [Alicyclobacillus fastidiosus]